MVLVDTHCHLNMMIKKEFDVPLHIPFDHDIQTILVDAQKSDVSLIINVGTSIVESKNCITLAQSFAPIFATVGIHPNDIGTNWRQDLATLQLWLTNKERNKIVGVGECGLDFHYPDYNIQLQKDVFKAQIELSLEHNVALVVHSRDAYDETLRALEEYRNELKRVIMHCFSYDQHFAQQIIAWNFYLGIGATISYPKNNELRSIVTNTDLAHMVLETDAPFLPPQPMRGEKNHPKNISFIADYVAVLKETNRDTVAQVTSKNALHIFQLSNFI